MMALLWLLILAAVEGMSLVSDPSPCLLDIADYRSSADNGCAPFHIVAIWLVGTFGGWFGEHNPAITATINALATGVIAYFTFTLWRSTDSMSKISDRQKEIAEQQSEVGKLQFFATHRPKIRTKHVVLSSGLSEKEPITADIWWINEGAARAIIFEFGIKFMIRPAEHMLPPITKVDWTITKLNQPLDPGISIPFPLATDGTTPDFPSKIGSGDRSLYCLGFIHYKDGAGNVRTTAFCRILEFAQANWVESARFRMMANPDPDYEYAS
jgi:hypothetical protein